MEKKPAKTPVAILVRVSTAKQETDRQVSELRSYADKKGYEVVAVCEETVSGRAQETERHGLREVEALAESGAVKKVLVHEVSRLARKNSIVHRFVENLEEKGVSLYWHAQGVETLLGNGKRNPAASIMLALLAEMARNEVETLSTRIKSGLAEAKKKGRKLGRPEGSTLERSDFLAKHRDIMRLLKAGQSVRNTAKITGKGMSTVQRVKASIGDAL
ncbi:recombinase family protein [Prosthecobacter dejongeii]|uniref:DNA invertase Pin-like site-specific DNA recombinase n=1 Tax=Prosthecobacter dejongeii TaxID=48465 RepID=A0A7W7YN04_9BACT|nr:recombinase family protein [Prosthecobacter dejongeii]MBB5038982.1 DNA invertase Pin-like site-specific DNA recombinase [Prosthecobacter dejongeii]